MTETAQIDHIRGEIRAEIALLNSRLNALLSSQSFLVIAYGSALGAGYGDWHGLFTVTLPPFLALFGFVLVLEARPGIAAAQEAIAQWRHREATLLDRQPELQSLTLATDKAERERRQLRQHAGTIFSTRLPIILLTAWTLMFLLPFILRVFGRSGL